MNRERALPHIAPDAPKSVVFAADEATNFLSRVLGCAVPLVRRMAEYRDMISPWRTGATEFVDTDDALIDRGEEIERMGIKAMDALHIASAAAWNDADCQSD